MKTNWQEKASFTPDEPWFSNGLGPLTSPYEWTKSGEKKEKGFGGPDLKRSVPGRFRKLTPAFKALEYVRDEHRVHHNGSAYLQEIQKIKELSEEELLRTRQELSNVLNELRERNEAWLESEKELQRTKALLEQYNFLSNHDLQEPLRKLQMFADLLSGPQAHLNDYARRYAEKINAAAARMSLLLKDLLSFSSARKIDVESFVAVDLNAMVKEVTGDLEATTQKKNVTVHCSPLPVIQGDRTQIKQIFHNLIGNAIKSNRGNVVMEISASNATAYTFPDYAELKPGTDYVCIRVTDNGIGFDQKYASKIFSLFQCLREKTDAKGTGTGLSMCKQIIENHGGFIYADGKKNVGAIFTLFFPCKLKAFPIANPVPGNS